MSAKRQHDDDDNKASDQISAEGQEKKLKSEKDIKSPSPEITATAAVDIKIKEVTNQTVKVEWNSPSSGKLYNAVLQSKNSQNGLQSKEIKADEDKKCSIEFTDLHPLTKYTLSIAPQEENGTTQEFVTRPSLEIPNIEEAQTRCAHLTLTPLPEDEGKNVEGYLLLVRPLEDAVDYPADGITDLDLKAKLEGLVQEPYYLAYEFTQEELTEEENGAPVMVGSGSQTKAGKYGSLQDPKLTSGAFYRVVFVAIMNLEGKRTVFAEESFRMLIP